MTELTTDRDPYYVLFLREQGTDLYTNEAGGSNRADLVAQANRALMRGAATAMVVRVEFYEGQQSQGRREPASW